MIIDARLSQLNEWLQENFGRINYTLKPLSGDASFRRYFRFESQEIKYIAVDSPPEKENNVAFANVTHLLAAQGLPVPHIFYSSLDFGFFLLSDLGDTLLLDILNQSNANTVYTKALDALLLIQQTDGQGLPDYNEKLLLQEMELFREWYLSKHLSLQLSVEDNDALDNVFRALVNNALQQPQVFVHRDYHSRNLMQVDGEYPGIIDYQDAVWGPITYDLVSLLRDCYIAWPDDNVKHLVSNYYEKLTQNGMLEEVDIITFTKWFDLMGVQRHLKAVGIFSRLNIRDNKKSYLKDIPRTLNYIKTISNQYSEIEFLEKLTNRI